MAPPGGRITSSGADTFASPRKRSNEARGLTCICRRQQVDVERNAPQACHGGDPTHLPGLWSLRAKMRAY
jgi:hypothetical protein